MIWYAMLTTYWIWYTKPMRPWQFIIYIVVRTRLNPEQAPLPEPDPNDRQVWKS